MNFIESSTSYASSYCCLGSDVPKWSLGGELPRTKNIFKRVREVFKYALKACCWYLLTFFKSIVFVVISGEWLLCRYCPLIPRRVMRGQEGGRWWRLEEVCTPDRGPRLLGMEPTAHSTLMQGVHLIIYFKNYCLKRA